MRPPPLLAFIVFTHTASAGICWSSMEKPGRCNSVLSERMTREDCCKTFGSAAWSAEDLDSGELFFWRALEGGAKCIPCDASCASKQCDMGRRCVVRDGQAKCICAVKCDRAGSVCGTDARTYRSLCKLRREACKKPHKHLTVAYNGDCQVGSCDKVRCSGGKRCVLDTELRAHCVRCSDCNIAESPLCGADGHTYAGVCALRRAACELGKSIPLAYRGPCIDVKENISCSTISCGVGQRCAKGGLSGARCITCDQCNSATQPRRRRNHPPPLCGSDGRTHRGWCEVQNAMCDTHQVINILHAGPCRGNMPVFA